jgi:plastocyanin
MTTHRLRATHRQWSSGQLHRWPMVCALAVRKDDHEGALTVHKSSFDTLRSRSGLTALVLAIGLLALAGCGGSSSGTSSSATGSTETTTISGSSTSTVTSTTSSTVPSGALSLAANPEGQLAYDKKSLTANAGKVSIDFTNQAPLDHNLTIESSSHQVLGSTPTFAGGSKVLTVDLKPGTYKFFCSVPGHRMAGMEGTLTVK